MSVPSALLSGLRMELYDWQRLVWSFPERHKVIAAGRRSGKTEFLFKRVFFDTMTSKDRGEGWITAETYRQAKMVLFDRIGTWLQDQPEKVMVGKNETELRFDLVDGRRLCLKGLDKPDSLRGAGLKALGMTECAHHGGEAWEQVLRPACADALAPVIFESSPNGRNWFYQLARHGGLAEPGKPSEKLEDWVFFRIKTELAGTVSKHELEKYRTGPTAMDPDSYAQEWEAAFLGHTGLLIPEFLAREWKDGNLIPEALWREYRRRCMHVQAMDWGQADKTFVLDADIDPYGRCIVYDEYVAGGKNIREIGMDMVARKEVNNPAIMMIADRTMWRTQYDGNQIAAQLEARGFNMTPSDSRFNESIARMRQMCMAEPQDGDPLSPMPKLMIVAGRCPNLIGQLLRVENKFPQRNNAECVGNQEVDGIDALRYLIMYGARSAEQKEEEEPVWPPKDALKLHRNRKTKYHPLSGLPMRVHD